jgi:acetyltransferase-like isoleucine patch superfamily enzyme
MRDPWVDGVDDEQVEIEPWFAVWSETGTWPGQQERQDELRRRIGARFGERCFVACGAHVVCSHLEMGDRSYIAAGCVIRDELVMGDDCTLNAGAVTAGRVRIGDGVRIAGHAALFGENHVFADPDRPIWHQGQESRGIVVGDDVWIGTHAVICDGVTVGDHSVVAAGAVVTRDVSPYSLIGGVPARVLRDRRDTAPGVAASRTAVPARTDGSAHTDAHAHTDPRAHTDGLARFDALVADQWTEVLARNRHDGSYRDHPGAGDDDRSGNGASVRPTCDAIEIAAAFGRLDDAGEAASLVRWLQSHQDEATGLFPDPDVGIGDDPLACEVGNEFRQYGVLSVGYALECLGAAPAHPVAAVRGVDGSALVALLDGLPWSTLAWPAGSWVDFWGTASYFNRRYHSGASATRDADGSAQGDGAGPVKDDGLSTLFGWLALRCDPRSGVWGPPDDTWGWLMPVNGAYRLMRGTYQQFDVPLPHPEALVDTVLAHGRDHRWFVTRQRNACNVLDVVHPLWLASSQCDHRRGEVRDRIAALLDRTLSRWVPGAGFAFGDGDEPGLQGTEMWLTIVFHMADLLGESDGLSWRPRGVHRLEAVDRARRTLR